MAPHKKEGVTDVAAPAVKPKTDKGQTHCLSTVHQNLHVNKVLSPRHILDTSLVLFRLWCTLSFFCPLLITSIE